MLEFLLLVADLAPPSAPALVVIDQPQSLSIALYYLPTCPHSRKVLSFLKERGISIPLKDVSKDPEAKKELKTVGGYALVPCLIVNRTPIYNDQTIIEWLSDHQDQLHAGNS